MKIAIINKGTGLKIAGMGVYAQSLKTFLEGKGHEVYELRFSKNKTSDPKVVLIPYYYADRASMVIVPSLTSASKIEKSLRKIKPDIVYINYPTSTLDVFLPTMCHKIGIPVAALWHGDYHSSSLFYRLTWKVPIKAYLSASKELDLMQVFSERIKEYFLEQGLEKNKVAVVPNGVDPKIYSPGKSQFGEKKKIDLGILFMGRMAGVKNPKLLIESFLQMNCPNGVKLVMMGGGEDLEELRDEFRSERVIFTGRIDDMAKKLDVIRSCQIFVLPSKFEGMSLSLLEAMSCGLCCVASDVGTNGEVLDGAGEVIPYQRLKKQLSQTLEELVSNRARAKEFGVKARARVLQNYSNTKTFSLLEKLLASTAAHYSKPKQTWRKFLHLDT